MMDDQKPVLLERYQILDSLGKGGMASVYRAFDTRLDCEVALKVIRSDFIPRSSEKILRQRFEREAKVVARLSHPNIIKVLDFGEDEGNPYLVMEYIKGRTLRSFLSERKQIPASEAIQLLQPIAEALGYSHAQGVIHRDIKPSNILLTESGRPLLSDFGIAKILEADITQDLTGTNTAIGTPEYMAPEQITSTTADERTDLYALGIVFYELISGKRPFEAETPLEVMVKQSRDPIPRISGASIGKPKELNRFLERALAKKPDDRFQNASEMSAAMSGLLDIIESSNNPGFPVETFKPPHFRVKGYRSKRIWFLYGFGIISIFGLLFLAGNSVRNKMALEKSITPIPILPLLTPSPSVQPTVIPTATSVQSTPTQTLQPISSPTTNSFFLKERFGSNVVFCYTGPGQFLYPQAGEVNAEFFEITGRNQTGNWLVIHDPANTKGQCWIDRSHFSIDQAVFDLPVVDPPQVTETIYYMASFSGAFTQFSGFPSAACANSWSTSAIAYCENNPSLYFCDNVKSKSYGIYPYIKSLFSDVRSNMYKGSCSYP